MKQLELIRSSKTDRYSIELELDNGVVLRVYSNPGYFHISIAGDDFGTPLEVFEKSANTLNLRYTPSR